MSLSEIKLENNMLTDWPALSVSSSSIGDKDTGSHVSTGGSFKGTNETVIFIEVYSSVTDGM